MDETSLKKCPFCGGNAEIVPVYDSESGFFGYAVMCIDCGCGTTGSEDENEVISQWNRRV